MAAGDRARRLLLAWLAASAAATGVVGCALLGGIGDLPFPPDGASVETGPDGEPADAADVMTDHMAGDSSDVSTQDGGCMAGLTFCGGSCVNTMQDPGNCGRCGHACQGGTCAGAGGCQPVALTDGSVFGTPFGIVVRGNTVYWVNNGPDGTILAVPVDGGPFASIAPNDPDAGQAINLALNDTTVYFTVGGSVMSSPLDGGAVTTLASGLGGADGIVLNATGVYFTDYSNPGGVFEVPLGGGTITTLAPAEENPGEIALSDTTAYWTASGAGAIDMVTLDGGSPENLTHTTSPFGIAVDSTSVYWTNGNGVFSIPLDGGTSTTLAQSEVNASGIAVDGTGVYWVNYGSSMGSTDGTVKMLPLDGGPEVTLATSQQNPQFIATDSTSVYWTNDTFGGKVMKVAKP